MHTEQVCAASRGLRNDAANEVKKALLFSPDRTLPQVGSHAGAKPAVIVDQESDDELDATARHRDYSHGANAALVHPSQSLASLDYSSSDDDSVAGQSTASHASLGEDADGFHRPATKPYDGVATAARAHRPTAIEHQRPRTQRPHRPLERAALSSSSASRAPCPPARHPAQGRDENGRLDGTPLPRVKGTRKSDSPAESIPVPLNVRPRRQFGRDLTNSRRATGEPLATEITAPVHPHISAHYDRAFIRRAVSPEPDCDNPSINGGGMHPGQPLERLSVSVEKVSTTPDAPQKAKPPQRPAPRNDKQLKYCRRQWNRVVEACEQEARKDLSLTPIQNPTPTVAIPPTSKDSVSPRCTEGAVHDCSTPSQTPKHTLNHSDPRFKSPQPQMFRPSNLVGTPQFVSSLPTEADVTSLLHDLEVIERRVNEKESPAPCINFKSTSPTEALLFASDDEGEALGDQPGDQPSDQPSMYPEAEPFLEPAVVTNDSLSVHDEFQMTTSVTRDQLEECLNFETTPPSERLEHQEALDPLLDEEVEPICKPKGLAPVQKPARAPEARRAKNLNAIPEDVTVFFTKTGSHKAKNAVVVEASPQRAPGKAGGPGAKDCASDWNRTKLGREPKSKFSDAYSKWMNAQFGARDGCSAHVASGLIREKNFDALMAYVTESDSAIHTRDDFGNTLLVLVCRAGWKKATKHLIKAGVDIDATNRFGNTALHFCFEFGHSKIAEYLIRKGASQTIRNTRDLMWDQRLDTMAGDEVTMPTPKKGDSVFGPIDDVGVPFEPQEDGPW